MSLFDFTERPRRLRRTPAIRDLVRETTLHPRQLIHPLFVVEGQGASAEEIESMPGQYRYTIEALVRKCRDLYELGIHSVALFPKLDASLKNPQGTQALDEDTLILRAVRAVKKALPQICIVADVALDPYTDHGHDGVLDATGTDVDNDATVQILAEMAVLNAQAGVDFIAPSDMMDGRVGAIRRALDASGLSTTAIMAYSAKFNSAYYGPFRDAVGSSKAAGTRLLGKHTYQCDPANPRAALREARLDAAEGADVLMVKPAGMYLDIIHRVREQSDLPIAAYQISGEYAQIHAAARLGWLDLKACRNESLLAIARAGADCILTYFAEDFAKDFGS